MKAEKFENLDVSSTTALLMAPKEDSEIITVKKACLVTVDVFTKYLKDQIMEIIDSDKVCYITPYFEIVYHKYSCESSSLCVCVSGCLGSCLEYKYD